MQIQATSTTRSQLQPTDFVEVLMGAPSEAEVEERYMALARLLLGGDSLMKDAA